MTHVVTPDSIVMVGQMPFRPATKKKDDLGTDVCYEEVIVEQLVDDLTNRATKSGFTGSAFTYSMSNDRLEREQQYSIREDLEEAKFIKAAIENGFLNEGEVYWITTRKINKAGHRKIIAIHKDRPDHWTNYRDLK